MKHDSQFSKCDSQFLIDKSQFPKCDSQLFLIFDFQLWFSVIFKWDFSAIWLSIFQPFPNHLSTKSCNWPFFPLNKSLFPALISKKKSFFFAYLLEFFSGHFFAAFQCSCHSLESLEEIFNGISMPRVWYNVLFLQWKLEFVVTIIVIAIAKMHSKVLIYFLSVD